jgi:hypothetical protein
MSISILSEATIDGQDEYLVPCHTNDSDRLRVCRHGRVLFELMR